MADASNATVTSPDVTLTSHPDSRDELRAYLIRYALWAVCGEGEKPELPPRLRDVGS